MKIPESINELRKICQVSFYGWGTQEFAFLQIRKVSIYFTWALLHFPLTANNVTVLAIATGLLASVLFGMNYLIAGMIVLQLSMVFDFCDGEVSRYRRQQSKEGSYLDKLYHFLVHPTVFAGLTIGAHQIHPTTLVVIVGFITTISVFANTMVKGYAGEIAIWSHSRRLLNKLNSALEVDPKDQALFSDLLNAESLKRSSETGGNVFIEKAKQSSLAHVISNISNKWDFPYIFFVVVVAAFIQVFIPVVSIGGTFFTPLELVLLFFAVTYPFWMIFFLSYILATRQIGRGYDSFAHDLLLLLKRTSNTNIDTHIKSDK